MQAAVPVAGRRQALALSYSAGGLLTSLPVLVMAVGAIPGAYLVSRAGARRAVSAGLALVTVGAALRGLFPNAVMVFAFTAVLDPVPGQSQGELTGYGVDRVEAGELGDMQPVVDARQ